MSFFGCPYLEILQMPTLLNSWKLDTIAEGYVEDSLANKPTKFLQ